MKILSNLSSLYPHRSTLNTHRSTLNATAPGRIRCLPRGCISVCAKWQERVPLLVHASVSPAVHIQSMLERIGTRAVCMA